MKPDKNGKKYIIISAVIIGLAFTGVTPLTVRFIGLAILGEPQVDTTGMAAVNIATFLSVLLSVIVGMVLAIIGLVKISTSKNRTS